MAGTVRKIWRWRFEHGLAFHREIGAINRTTVDDPWADWEGWRVRIELKDRNDMVVTAFDSEAGEDGVITFEDDGTVNFDMSSGLVGALTPTGTVGRDKTKAQLEGVIYVTNPDAPDEPYAVDPIVKATVKGV